MEREVDVSAKAHNAIRGVEVCTPAISQNDRFTERLLKQDLNPIRVMTFFALGLRGSELKQVTQ